MLFHDDGSPESKDLAADIHYDFRHEAVADKVKQRPMTKRVIIYHGDLSPRDSVISCSCLARQYILQIHGNSTSSMS